MSIDHQPVTADQVSVTADQVYVMLGVASSLFGASTKMPNSITLFLGADAWMILRRTTMCF